MVSEGRMNLETLIYEKKEHVSWITLNRPEVLNTQNFTLLNELNRTLDAAKDDEETRVIVITGAGMKSIPRHP